jgi:hypothetical protein
MTRLGPELTHTISGTKIEVTSLSGPGMLDGGAGDAGTSDRADFCVSGNTLMIATTSSSGSGGLIVMTK